MIFMSLVFAPQEYYRNIYDMHIFFLGNGEFGSKTKEIYADFIEKFAIDFCSIRY